MKFVIGILLIALVLLGIIAYLYLMMSAREMIFCGDVQNNTGASAAVTRVYTTDLSANETLSEIIIKMNEAETNSLEISELTEVLAQYQNIVYAPVFTVNVEQIDTATYIITGSVFNGIDEKGNEAETDYRFEGMNLNTVVTNGRVVAAQNIYDDAEADEEPVFKQRQSVIDPIVTGADSEAAFSLQDCSSYKIIVNSAEFTKLPEVTLVFVYNVDAANPLDFTSVSNDSLAVNMKIGPLNCFEPISFRREAQLSACKLKAQARFRR